LTVGLLTERAVEITDAIAGSGDGAEGAAVEARAKAASGVGLTTEWAAVLASSSDTSEIGLNATNEGVVSDLSVTRERIGDDLTVDGRTRSGNRGQGSQEETGEFSVLEVNASRGREVENVSVGVASDGGAESNVFQVDGLAVTTNKGERECGSSSSSDNGERSKGTDSLAVNEEVLEGVSVGSQSDGGGLAFSGISGR